MSDDTENDAPTWRDFEARRPAVIQAYAQAHGPLPDGPIRNADWKHFLAWLSTRPALPAKGAVVGDSAEKDVAVTFEVWRSHPRGADVRLYHGMSEEQGKQTLTMCEADQAEGYPDAPAAFYLVRATTTYERVLTPAERTSDE